MTTLQSFLARATTKAAEDLVTAFERIPEEKRSWSAMGDARTALDQVAEVALLNGSTCSLLEDKKWPEEYDFNDYFAKKAELAGQGWETIKAKLEENTKKAAAVIGALPSDALEQEVSMPWGAMTIAQIASYPYWNACYHEGQVNYIASMLGCLE